MSTPPCDGRQGAPHSAAGLRAPAQDHLAVQRAQHGVLARREQPGGLPLWHAAAEPRARAPGGRARGRGPGGCRRRHRGQRRDEHRHRMLDVGRAFAACARRAGAGQHALGAPRRMDGRRAAGRNLAALPAGRAVRARAVRCWRAACSSAAHCHFGMRHAARATCGAPSKSACGHESAVRQLMCSRTTVHRREGRVRMRGSITDAPAGSVPGALRARRWPPGALCAHRARWPHAARRVGACAMGGRARAQYEEALASRLLRRPGSALGACCGRGGGGYLATARAELRDAVRPAGKRLWASEFGCGTAPLDDMRDAVALSAVILQARPPRLCAQSCCLALSRRARWRRPAAWRGCAARGAAPPCVVQHGGRWLSTVECVRGADRPPRARAPGPQRASGKRVGVLAGDRELGDRQLLGPHPGGRLQRSQLQRPSPACLSSPPKLLIAPAFQACPAHGHARGQGVRKVQHRGRARSCPSIRAPA